MTTKLMAGIDLHSNNLFCGIVDMEGKRVFEQKLSCDMAAVLKALKPFKKRLEKIAFGSTIGNYSRRCNRRSKNGLQFQQAPLPALPDYPVPKGSCINNFR